MKFSALATAAGLALSAALPAHALTTVYHATLSGLTEAPPNASAGVGFAIVTVDDSTFTMRVQSIFAGLQGTVTAAHIHCCTAVPGSGNVGVATMTPTFSGFPAGVTSGTYDFSFDMGSAASWNTAYLNANGGTTASAFASLQTGLNSGSAYFNIHSTLFPGGEIRGFLVSQVPEPSALLLMALGLGVVGGVTRRRPS